MRIGITGHQRIPSSARRFIEERVRDFLTEAGTDLVGISALAAGADQLFAREVIALGGSLHVVVPATGYEETFSAAKRISYERLLSRAATVERLPYPTPSEEAFLGAGERVVQLSDLLVAVWNGLPAQGKGGTGDVVSYAQKRGVPVRIVWPSGHESS